MIRVVVADDHQLVRRGIQHLLDELDGIEVVGEAANGQEALAQVAALRPDVLLLDLNMPQGNGLEVAGALQASHPQTGIVVLTMYGDESLIHQAVQLGVKAYLLKQSQTLGEELLLAVRAAATGALYLSPLIAEKMGTTPPSGGSAPREQLTAREQEVLELIVHGHSNREMAERLKLSVKTIEKHRNTLMQKVGAEDVVSLVRLALQRGLVFVQE